MHAAGLEPSRAPQRSRRPPASGRGSGGITPPDVDYLCCLGGTASPTPAAPPRRGAPRARRRSLWQLAAPAALMINQRPKTFNNGSLGSGIDEERSKMR